MSKKANYRTNSPVELAKPQDGQSDDEKFSARQKFKAVQRLNCGDSLETLSRELGVAAKTLRQWQKNAREGALNRLQNKIPNVTKIIFSDKKAKEMVKRFLDDFIWVKSVHYIFIELYENKNPEKLMREVAINFFQDLNHIILEYFLLKVCAITDPAGRAGKENMTLENLFLNIIWSKEDKKKLGDLNAGISKFREKVVLARNKAIAHHDKEIFLAGEKLGQFEKDAERLFLDDIEKACNIMHKACFGHGLGEIWPLRRGDVQDLKHALKKAIALDKYFSECGLEECGKICALLK